jgi:hypothetical protein
VLIQLKQIQQQLESGIALVNQTIQEIQVSSNSQYSIMYWNILQVTVQPPRMAKAEQADAELAQEILEKLPNCQRAQRNYIKYGWSGKMI